MWWSVQNPTVNLLVFNVSQTLVDAPKLQATEQVYYIIASFKFPVDSANTLAKHVSPFIVVYLFQEFARVRAFQEFTFIGHIDLLHLRLVHAAFHR